MNTMLITGANRGLGLEWVRQLDAAGWRVHATYREEARAAELLAIAKKSNQRIVPHKLDVTNFAAIDTLALSLKGESIDVLNNNAGILPARKPFGQTDYGEWARLMNNNLFAYLKMAEAFVDQVGRSQRKIILCMTSGLSSLSAAGTRSTGSKYGDGKHMYRTTKAAVNMLAISLAGYLRERGIIVLSVTPGWANTEMGRADLDPGYTPDDLVDPVKSIHGMRKIIDTVTLADSGRLMRWDGSTLPF